MCRTINVGNCRHTNDGADDWPAHHDEHRISYGEASMSYQDDIDELDQIEIDAAPAMWIAFTVAVMIGLLVSQPPV